MKKILIVENSFLLAASLAELLSQKYMVHTCHGADIRASVEALRPDALIVNIRVTGIDSLIDLYKTAVAPPILFIIADILTEQLLLTATAIGTSHIALIPFSLRTFVQRLDDLICGYDH